MSKKKDKKKEEVSSKQEEIKDKEETINQETNENEQTETSETDEQEKQENELLDKYNTLNDKYLRLVAEYDNYRKRTLKEKMDLIKGGGADVLKSILPVIDNFERALKSLNESSDLEAVKEGITLIYTNLREFLKQRGVIEIEAMGKVLDTDLHEAIAQMPTEEDDKKGKIIDVIEKGYILNEKVLRFAKVVVAQ